VRRQFVPPRFPAVMVTTPQRLHLSVTPGPSVRINSTRPLAPKAAWAFSTTPSRLAIASAARRAARFCFLVLLLMSIAPSVG
jgi:hypothetical protein